jgi:predicted RNA-binding protein with PIN domain
MPTHVIIDGYNLLGRMGQTAPFSEMAREELIRKLVLYRQRTGHALTVVFDGWQGGMGAEGHEHRAGVGVIYTKRGERADQVIQRLAVEYGGGCAVVSSDREVGHTATAHGAFLIAAGEFASRLNDSSRRETGPPERGIKDEDDDPRRARDPKKKGNPRKLPKSQRRRNQHLKRF